MKKSTNKNGKTYGLEDFPEIKANRIYEYMIFHNRRMCVIRLDVPTFESCHDAIIALNENPIVYHSQIYGAYIFGWM